jgi:hypothetical protein
MSRFIEAANAEVLSVDEAQAQLAHIDQSDPSFSVQVARVLLGLYNNRTLLKTILNSVLANDERIVFYSPQSFSIGAGCFAAGGKYVLRGNVWFPQRYSGVAQALEDFVYSYDNCHDHNFDFYTVGYSGPGYYTDLYEYDQSRVSGIIGEQVALRPAGTVQLKPGTVLHFRKGVDVHTQRHPAALSVSFNLLVQDDTTFERAQYEFDPTSNTLQSTIYSTSMNPTALAFLVGELGCKDVALPLFEVLRASAMWQHRFAAGRALLQTGLAENPAALGGELNLPAGADLSQTCNVY